ncbi:MAG: asparagine synthase (glutamine-hydrolyzing) [Defluviitaleaceae bacterium]|nr:asparagine synthase (glutamine-hydrolyzing) [Defluviitaleaceae bacterium]
MCGIAGEAGNLPLVNNLAVWGNMQRALKRRGPDQSGIYTNANATLIHTRLSVVDLENGAQPMIFTRGDEEYALVYNGELYNTNELRDELIARGHTFQSHSDTEVLLHAYMKWKEECVERLNGIFAFAVWESHAKRLFIARDRIGVKPFFYAHRGEEFLFASEIKSLLANKKIRAEIDTNSIAEIVLLGPGRTPGYGVFRGVNELPPAHCGFFGEGGLTLRRYWQLEDKPHTDTFEQTVEKVRFLVTDSIRRQLVSDVPVGAFLSGGLDSGIISAVAAQERPLQTFSVYYKDNDQFFKKSKFQPDSDDKYIEIMSKHLGTKHHRIEIDTDDLINALEAAVDARDLPGMADIDASLLLFCKEVKNHVTVALSGEGADEIFGGYPWYRDKDILMRDGFPWATNPRRGFLKKEQANYVQERCKKTLQAANILPNHSPHEHRMKEMINLNMHWFMQTLLDRKDRMSMYNGLEVRVPFCDFRIIEYLYTVPWEIKDHKSREKGLLREAMRGLLPDDVLWRKKSPYPKTHNPAYLAAVSKKLREVISDPSAPILQIVRKEALENLLKTTSPIPWYGQLMTTPQTIAYFLQVNYWLQKYDVTVI